MMLDTYLAIDFGAGSGRVMAGFVSAPSLWPRASGLMVWVLEIPSSAHS